jgi:hypothetical protein
VSVLVQEPVDGDHFRDQPAETDIPDSMTAAQMVGDLPRQLTVSVRTPVLGQRTGRHPGQGLGDIGVTLVVMLVPISGVIGNSAHIVPH